MKLHFCLTCHFIHLCSSFLTDPKKKYSHEKLLGQKKETASVQGCIADWPTLWNNFFTSFCFYGDLFFFFFYFNETKMCPGSGSIRFPIFQQMHLQWKVMQSQGLADKSCMKFFFDFRANPVWEPQPADTYMVNTTLFKLTHVNVKCFKFGLSAKILNGN